MYLGLEVPPLHVPAAAHDADGSETMQTHDIAPPLENLKRALGDKVGNEVTEEDLKDELQKYLDYGVPPDQAVRTILRHHGADPGAPASKTPAPSGRVPLADAPPDAPTIELLVKVMTMNPRTVNARGEEKEILWGLIGDETASLAYTAWRPLEGVEVGDVLHIENAYTKEWRGETQINFGDRTKITKKDPSELPAEPAEVREAQVEDLQVGLRGFKVTGRLLDVSTREVQVQGEPKTLWTGFFADETGKIEFTCWDDVGLEAGQVMTIEGGYVRAFRNTPQLNFDKEATLTPFEGDFPDAEVLEKAAITDIHTVLDRGSGDFTLRATMLEVRPGSGLVWRDPETRRVVPSGGDGTEPDLRIKMTLDDGTGAVNAVVGRAFVEEVLGKTLDECLAEAKEAMRPDIIQEQLEAKVVGRVFLADGFARTDDYGTMFIARSMKETHEDMEATAKALLERLEAI